VPESFISTYLKHTSIYESPTSFWKWSAYASIAAILRDNCYLIQGDSRLYTNIYVLFLAESSGHRKGRPVDLSESIVTKINNTKIISGRSSIQAILDELARAETDKKTGKVKKAGAAIFYAPEMSAGIVADPDALKILTDIYDYKTNPYKSRLRTGPCFNLERITFSMLAASNEAMLKGLINTAEIQGGFLARTLLVTPDEVRPPNSLMRIDVNERTESKKLVMSHFELISQLNGEFFIDEDAIDEYEGWYKNFRLDYQKKKEQSGVVGRVHTTVLKVAMLLAANDLTLFVKKSHIEEAINECLCLMPNYSVFTMSNGKSDREKLAGVVMTELISARANTISRKEFIRKNWQMTDPALLDSIVVTLEQSGMVQQIVCKDGIYFKLTDTCLNMLGQQQ